MLGTKLQMTRESQKSLMRLTLQKLEINAGCQWATWLVERFTLLGTTQQAFPLKLFSLNLFIQRFRFKANTGCSGRCFEM